VKSEVVSDSSVNTTLRFHQWVSALMAIYLMPPIREDEEIEAYGRRIASVVDQRSAVIATQIRNVSKRGV
jgi:hypothetical protein